MDNKIYNKKSKRWVTVNGNQYNKLLKGGWRINDQYQLSPPKNSTQSLSKKSITYIEKNINDVLSTQLVMYLSPNDLLSLYLSSKENQVMLNSSVVLTILNNKYNTNATSFTDWYKSYVTKLIPDNKNYLYHLEESSYIDSNYLNDLGNGKFDFNKNTYLILYDWIYTISNMLRLELYIVSYWSTLFLVFASKYQQLTKTNAQLYGCCILYYCTLLFEEYPEEVDIYISITDKAFDEQQFEDARKIIFNTLQGVLIYPSPALFVDTNNKNLVTLTNQCCIIS